MTAETIEFQAEARQLLQLMVHSIYSNRDVFLRELISNASDALDKLRLETYRDKDLQVDVSDLHVEIVADPQQRTLAVRDNGIGMTRDEVVALIGTIAKSGTAEMLASLRAAAGSADGGPTPESSAVQELIGKFGVGFYSTFMVADSVTLLTRRAGAEVGVRWESAGEGTYTIEQAPDAPQGTTVTVSLKPADADDQMPDYTDPATIRRVVKRYSDFITWPIRMAGQQPQPAEGDEAAPAEPETLNRMKALWARPRSEVTDTEYAEFYRHVSHDWQEPLETIRLQAEGTFEYQALLFLPARAPLDLFMRERRRGVQLYVRRVFIMDDCEALVPDYLRFVKGVVDAADLSLNVSREILQQDRQIQLIRKRLVRKVLGDGQVDADRAPGAVRHVLGRAGPCGQGRPAGGPGEPRPRSWRSARSPPPMTPTEPTTLQAYKQRMPEGQEQIYYMTGESRTAIENSPHMEALRAKGYEVLLLTDPIDEVWVDSVPEFDGTPLTSIAKGQVELDDEGGTADDEKQRFAGAAVLDGHHPRRRGAGGAADLEADHVAGLPGRRQPGHDPDPGEDVPGHGPGPAEDQADPGAQPGHPLVAGLRAAHEQRPDDAELAGTARLLHDMALLAEGGELTNPARFVSILAQRLERAL